MSFIARKGPAAAQKEQPRLWPRPRLRFAGCSFIEDPRFSLTRLPRQVDEQWARPSSISCVQCVSLP